MSLRTFDHVDLVLGGTLRTTDSWSVSFVFNKLDLSAWSVLPGDLDVFCGHADTEVHSHFGTTSAHGIGLSASGSYASSRAYYRQANNPHAVYSSETKSSLVGSNTASSPNQVAIVHSLLTARAGRSNRGRCYWPWLASTGSLTSTNVTNLATEMAAFITAMNTHATTDFGVAIAASVGRGGTSITKVRVDDVCDTQRRRRDKQFAVNIATATV